MAVLGANAVVLTKFMDAAMLHLSASQRADVSVSFIRHINDAPSALDDFPLPPEYLSTLVGLTDAIESALKRQVELPRVIAAALT